LSRLKLVIPVTAFPKYEISRQAALSSPIRRIPFATTAVGLTLDDVSY
jgi:hypothetical protein